MKNIFVFNFIYDRIKLVKDGWGEKKYHYILKAALVIETVCLLYSLFLFVRPEAEYIFSGEELVSGSGIYINDFLGKGVDGYYLDNGVGTPDEGADGQESPYTIASPAINLKRGSYRVVISYDTNDNTNTYTSSSSYNTWPVTAARQNVGFIAGGSATTFTFSSPIRVEGYQVSLNFNGNGYLFADSISIVETSIWKRLNLFWTIVLSLLVNAVCIMQIRLGKTFTREKKAAVLSMILLIGFSSLPVFSCYIQDGGDLNFHLYRIEGVKNALSAGQFPVRMPFSWLNGYGYAVSVFYGELFLYFPAVLRMIGFSIQGAYKCYILGVNAATCLMVYYCLRRIFQDDTACLAGCAVYVLSPYRLSCLYTRAAVGEYTAMLFFPLIAYGLYRIFTEEVDAEGYRHSWIPAALGYSGIIQCHVISCMMAGIFTLLLCVVFIRKTLKPGRLVLLVKTVIYTLLLNLWFILPFLDYMRFGYSVTDLKTLGRFNANGVFLNQLFSIFPYARGASFSMAEGIGQNGEMSYALGAGIMAAAVLYLYHRICNKTKERNFAVRLGDFSLCFGCLAAFMTTIWFPWDFIQQWNAFFALLTQSIQFPWRFLGMVTLFISLTAACLVFLARDAKKKESPRYVAGLLVLLSVLSAGYSMDDYTREEVQRYLVEEDAVNSCNIMLGEYLPDGTDKDMFNDTTPIWGEQLTVIDYEKESGVITMTCKNERGVETFADLPFLYYKGYQAVDDGTKEKLTVLAGTGGRLRVVFPAGYEGTCVARFHEPWYWRVSEAVSAMAAIALAFHVRQSNGPGRRCF